MVKTDVLIIGGGVAGLSTAYFLGKSGRLRVVVIEQERGLGGHASGRNAGMLRQAVPDPVLAQLARESRRYFEKLEHEGWKGVRLKKRGSLLLAKGSKVAELKAIEKNLIRQRIGARWLSHRQIERRVPLLQGGDFSRGLFCGSDATLELSPLLDGFVRSLKRMDIPVFTGLEFRDVRSVPGGFLVRAGGRVFQTKKIVNAAGAWASWVGRRAGASKVPLNPYRRHLFSAAAPEGSRAWPFVWDVSHDFYFRPTPDGLLLSPCDRSLEKRADRLEKVDPRMGTLLRRKLGAFSKGLGRLSVKGARSGLRTMAPDGRFVVGEDPAQKGFFWVAGLGGHGVTTCFSVGRLAANLILRRRTDARIEKALSPKRFAK